MHHRPEEALQKVWRDAVASPQAPQSREEDRIVARGAEVPHNLLNPVPLSTLGFSRYSALTHADTKAMCSTDTKEITSSAQQTPRSLPLTRNLELSIIA